MIGYILEVFAASVFGPAIGSMTNELFPTAVRASVVGWSLAVGVLGAVVGLIVFGVVARSGQPFALAGLLTFLPVVPAGGAVLAAPGDPGPRARGPLARPVTFTRAR